MVFSKKRILFISPSDIVKDSRILKQISVAKSAGFEVLALGIKYSNRSHKNSSKNIISFNLYSRILNVEKNIFFIKFLIDSIKTIIMTFEILLKFLPNILKYRPHIIHCSDYTFLPLAALYKLLTKAKIIYDVHELESQTNSISKYTSCYVFNLEKFLWPFIDVSLHVSDSIREWYEKEFGVHKSEIILNSPTICNLKRNSNYFRETFNIPENIKIFLYLGILGRGRGIETALRIFSDLESTATIIFMGYGDKAQQIKEYSKKFSNIYLHPLVPHDEVVDIASSANFGYCVIENASLSDYYCLPNKLFEYVFSGLPVLASKFPDISKVVTEFNLGILTDLDESSIRYGINELLINRSRKKFLNQDLSPLGWDFQSEKLKAVLNRLSAD